MDLPKKRSAFACPARKKAARRSAKRKGGKRQGKAGWEVITLDDDGY